MEKVLNMKNLLEMLNQMIDKTQLIDLMIHQEEDLYFFYQQKLVVKELI
jgi:hypothetical protein